MNLLSILSQTAKAHISKIQTDGSMPSGHNGPYNDQETKIRNTSHWTCAFALLYKRTNNNRFLKATQRTGSFLQSDEARPKGWTFSHRNVENKDRCNGLIGQAWTIEALSEAARVLNDKQLAALAEEVFLLHPQDEQTGLWKRVEIDGQTLPYDATFNHQLWFASAAGLLAALPWSSNKINDQVKKFLDELEQNLRLYSSGLIFHPLKPVGSLKRLLHLTRTDKKNRIGMTFLTSSIPLPSYQNQLKYKAIGYHAFNLYAFALLKKQYPDHSFWKTSKWNRALRYVCTSEYQNDIWENKYGSSFNPVGFEIPFAMDVFDIGSSTKQRRWVTRQLARHYNSNTLRMDRNTPDEETLTARMYQAARLTEFTLSNFKQIFH